MLGPARFSHIEICALEVCREFKRKDEVQECLSTLASLDDILLQLRAELAVATASEPSTESSSITLSSKPLDYSAWIDTDLPRARRLIRAREGAIKAVKAALAKRRPAESDS